MPTATTFRLTAEALIEWGAEPDYAALAAFRAAYPSGVDLTPEAIAAAPDGLDFAWLLCYGDDRLAPHVADLAARVTTSGDAAWVLRYGRDWCAPYVPALAALRDQSTFNRSHALATAKE